MASSALSLQWGLDVTATGTLSIGKGLMMAATSDNVSPLALSACERFGATLPASSMSLQKVESALIPRSPAPVAFLKATVGFIHNDCATQLGTSAAGVRFLGFAAALVPTAGVFQSAITLDKMLRDSASDLTFVPTQQGLRDLLRVLEPRAPACGFFDTVIFCQRLVEEQVIPKVLSTNIPADISHSSARTIKDLMLEGVPPADTLAELINAFRQIGRLGLATVATLTIRTGTGIPWVLAFTQWCLDSPISLSIGNFNVLAPANAKVHILVPEDANDLQKRIKITIHHQLEKLDTLIQPYSQDTIEVPSASYRHANRLVTFGAYRDFMIRRLGFDKCCPELLREAIEYSIPLFLSRPLPLSLPIRTHDNLSATKKQPELDSYRLYPFPRLYVVSSVAGKLLSLNEPLSFKKLDEGQSFANLPNVSRHLAQLPKMRCHECHVTDRLDAGFEIKPWDIGYCSKGHFVQSLTLLTCEILAISLFQDPESIFIQASIDRRVVPKDLTYDLEMLLSVSHIPFSRTPFQNRNLVRLAKQLVGHDDGTGKPKDDIISCRHGQVVYHAIFDTFRVQKYGYAELICLPGVLRYKGETFNSLVKGELIPNIFARGFTNMTRLQNNDLLMPRSFDDSSISWHISVSEEVALEAMLQWTSKKGKIIKSSDPSALLDCLGGALILETCAHSQDTQVEVIEDNIFDAPAWGPDYNERYVGVLKVVRVGKAADQLCFALASIRQIQTVVIGKGACFGCCVKLCRTFEAHVLLFCTSRS